MTWPARYVYVAALEGVDTLLTNGDTSAVVTAWNGTDWTSATGGLFVNLDHQLTAQPWEPFTPGGTLTLSIADDAIGILTHRTAGGAETPLAVGLDRDDTTLTVLDTAAFPSSGTVSIGTETIAYTGTTSTSFTGITRGKYSPFGCDSSGTGTNYTHDHRIGNVGYGPALTPKVTQYPRKWMGRWVGLWVHGVNSDGSLQARADAQLVFAGRIVEVRDDPESLGTIIVCDHILTGFKDATVGRDMFTAEVPDGVYLPAGVTFGHRDYNGSTWKTANELEVVASGASGANEMDAGFYSHAQLFEKINTWWASELVAGRISGSYMLVLDQTSDALDSIRTKVGWHVPGSTGASWVFTLPKVISIFLGFNGDPIDDSLGSDAIGEADTAGVHHSIAGDFVPLRSWVSNGLSNIHLRLESLSGAFQDQLSTLPGAFKVPPNLDDGREWGLFRFDDQVLVRGAVVDNGDGTYDLEDVQPSGVLLSGNGQAYRALDAFSKRMDDPSPTKISQVFFFEMPAKKLVNRLMLSSGTTGWNHGTHDDLPYGVGLGYPGELFGTAWENSVANMPGADKPLAVMLDKPTKLSTLIGSDLVLRHVFPTWKDGGLKMATWQTPSAALAIASLTEDNKAEPSGHDVNHRSSTLLSNLGAKNIIKIEYNRDLLGGEYQSTINIEDRTAVDDAGDRSEPITIEARNTFAEFAETGAGIEDVVPSCFVPAVTLFTTPMRTLRRSISIDLWDLAPGDIVKASDSFARDPSTGIRRVSNRPAIVTSVKFSPGGAAPNTDTAPIVGEVDLMFVESNRIYAYAPSAEIASYNSGTKTITCTAHAYSESSESADAANFAAGDKARMIEIDPADPAAPLTWTFGIVSRSGNDLVHDGVALAGYVAGRKYRIVPDTYSAVQSSQQDKAFQADDADGLIEDAAQANTFGLVSSSVAATSSSHTDLPERHADLQFGDGKPFDVGSIVGFARMVNNFWDHKSAICTPMLSATAVGNSTYSSGQGWKLVLMRPVFLSAAMLSNSVVRYISVAPWLRSTDGTATSVRVSLCPLRYKGNTLDDIDRGSIASDQTWNTSSTTWAMGTPALLTCNVKTDSGLAWLLVECNYKAETRGLAKAVEQERSIF